MSTGDDNPVQDVDPSSQTVPYRAWKIGGVLITAAAITVAIGSVSAQGKCGANCRIVKALNVSQPSPGIAHGGFQLIVSQQGIETDNYGGACLIFKDPRGISCVHSENDCSVPLLCSRPNHMPPLIARRRSRAG